MEQQHIVLRLGSYGPFPAVPLICCDFDLETSVEEVP